MCSAQNVGDRPTGNLSPVIASGIATDLAARQKLPTRPSKKKLGKKGERETDQEMVA